jgi:putative endonuclease
MNGATEWRNLIVDTLYRGDFSTSLHTHRVALLAWTIPLEMTSKGVRAVERYWVYIVASKTRRTYIGMTSNLEQRIRQHRTGHFDGHTSQYNKHRLVLIEEYQWVHDAIARERQLKTWSQGKKHALIEAPNPSWDDLAADWFAE